MLLSNILLLSVASVTSAGVVHAPLTARSISESPHVAAYLAKRDIYHATPQMGRLYYETELEIGTPPQVVKAVFDTGSPLLWVHGSNSTQCLQGHCQGSFNVSKSSTWHYLSESNNWGGIGNWGNETVSYAGQTLTDFETWVSKGDPYMWFEIGIFGQSGTDDPRQSFVQGLADSGKISRAVYSLNAEKPILWNKPSSKGTVNNVYYGGYDRAKYQGPLTTIKCDHHNGYAMPLGGISIEGKRVKTTRDYQIVLDTGGINLTLPNGTIKALSEAYGGNGVYEAPGYFKCKCDTNPVVTLNFGYTDIDIDLKPYMLPSPHGDCWIGGIKPVSDDTDILLNGPPVISQALVIYDNHRDTITIGKAKFTDESDVVEITGDIPGTVNYEDWLAGKPLPSSVVSSTTTSSAASSTVQRSTLAIVTTSQPKESAQPEESAQPDESSQPEDPFDFCDLFGIFC
ncbi:YALIA101S06e04742g1_1 [Yarrowia lipolytica]|nr:Rhizopuspepsin-3 [Yarrowia lipolytica]SEI35216.1 YALIA101S06e04742g1_1 [Yarrowia lipolytica]